MNGGAQADTFRFSRGNGSDTVAGFADDVDTIEIAGALAGGRTAQQIVAAFATQADGNTVLDFGNGDALRVLNVAAAELVDDILIA